MSEVKNIGVLTSGGDAPGMNAAIRSVVRAGIYNNFKVFGIKRGYNGLISGDINEIGPREVSGILKRGGTILKTARCLDFMKEEGRKKAVSMAGIFGLDAIVVIGGDGSYKGARDISQMGLPVIGIPGTIDNDIASTDYTIGYDTALNTAIEAIDKIRDTSYSHERCSIIEVMGRRAGYIALTIGITAGAEAVVVPEKEFNLDSDVIKPIIKARNAGKTDYIVIVAEGVGKVMEMAQNITDRTGIEARAAILGHIQRGGTPSVYDRYIASLMGVKAIELIKNNDLNRVVSFKNDKLIGIEINEAIEMKKTIEPEILNISKILAI
jgi:6-phosphofructokinase 1